jgi:hypothetical protein
MFQRRLVTLWAWLMRFPACGFLPQISHCCAIGLLLPNDSDLVGQASILPEFTGFGQSVLAVSQPASLVRTTLYIEMFLQEHFYRGRAENK